MNALSTKTVALTAVLALGSLMSSSAHAALLRTSSGAPVLTSSGGCVTTGWEGEAGCEAAKRAAGIPNSKTGCMDDKESIYFGFNQSGLTPHDKNRLDHLVRKIHAGHKKSKPMMGTITVTGFADRIGNAAANEKLALKRARAVRDYLVSKGVKASKIEVHSLGQTASRTDCPDDLSHAKMIQCLREDRRVEIEYNPGK